MKAISTRVLLVAACAAAVALASPGVLYAFLMWRFESRPVPALPLNDVAVEETQWLRCSETLPVTVETLNPWRYAFLMLNEKPEAGLPRGSRTAWQIARAHNLAHLDNRSWWHPAGAALTIWLTRNWSARQLVATAARERLC